MTWEDIADKILLFYFFSSIVIELLEFIFYLTPNTDDDKIIAKIKSLWGISSKYFAVFSIKTPLTFCFYYLSVVIAAVFTFIKSKIKK